MLRLVLSIQYQERIRGWAKYFVFSILYSNCQYLIFKPQCSIFRLPYLCYLHYLNNYDLPRYSLFFYKSHVRYCKTQCFPLQRVRGTQRQFSENICSEDDFRSRIFGTFVVKFCLPASPRIFEHLKNGIIAYF